jgi:hypothetical protein
MMLLTKVLKTKLIDNHNANYKRMSNGNTIDFEPVVKFFNPVGAATWLITELDPDTNIMFGLCDLGLGFPEIGSVSLDELSEVKLSFGLGIERDLRWTAEKTLSEYADAARSAGGIVA